MSDLTQEEFDNYWDTLHPPRPVPPERAILLDLIEELRGYRHRARNDMADHYEQRLREVLGE